MRARTAGAPCTVYSALELALRHRHEDAPDTYQPTTTAAAVPDARGLRRLTVDFVEQTGYGGFDDDGDAAREEAASPDDAQLLGPAARAVVRGGWAERVVALS